MKKLIAFLTILCMVTSCMGLNAFAVEDTPLIISATVTAGGEEVAADGAVGVDINTDLTIEFDGFVDAAKFDRDKVIVNGSHDMVTNFVYDDINPTVMTIDLKELGFGKRYVVELRDVSLDEGANKVNTVIAFTTVIPGVEPTQVGDATGNLIFASWNTGNAGNMKLDTTEYANKTNSSWATWQQTIKNFQNVDKVRIYAKTTSGSTASKAIIFSNTASTSCNALTQVTNQRSVSIRGDKYAWIDIPVIPKDTTTTEARFWIEEGVYIKHIQVIPKSNLPSVTNNLIREIDATKSRIFAGFNPQNAGGGEFDATEQANKITYTWSLLTSSHIRNFQNVDKLRIYAKTTTGATANMQAAFSKTSVENTNTLAANMVAKTATFSVPGDDYAWVDVPVVQTNTTVQDAILWVTAKMYIKYIQVVPKGYFEGKYYYGDFDLIKNYGEDDEEVMTNGGIEAGNYSAVLNGFYNTGAGAVRINLANALYQNGNLVSVKMNSALVETGRKLNAPLVATLENVPDYEEGMEIKTFLWDHNQKPLKDSISITYDKRVRVLVAGNSITYHQPAKVIYGDQTINWTGSWGMAASSEANDYAHRLIASADKAGYNTEFVIGNVKGLETDPSADLTTWEDYKNFDPDVLVIALGANVGSAKAAEFVPAYKNLIDYIGADEVIVVTTICGGSAWDSIRAMAADNGWELVDCLKTYNDNSGNAQYTWDYMAQGTFGNNSVGWHPGNGGMQIMANQIWTDALNATIQTVAATK